MGIYKKTAEKERNKNKSETSNVIDFALKSAEIKADRFMDSLTAEQKLKLQILETMFSIEKVAEMLLQNKQLTIDDLFRLTAEKIFEK